MKIWLEKKKERDGGNGAKAAVGIMRKLAMAAWHVGQGEVFDPKRLFPGTRHERLPRPKKCKDSGVPLAGVRLPSGRHRDRKPLSSDVKAAEAIQQ